MRKKSILVLLNLSNKADKLNNNISKLNNNGNKLNKKAKFC
jgi:hypothetical protein